MSNLHELLHNVRMLFSNIIVFVYILGEVVQVWLASFGNHLPVAHADSYLIGFFELPIQEVVSLMGKDVIIACDFSSAETCLNFLDKFTEEKPFVKIGMELYYAEGPSIVKALKARGHKVFLDLKLHDIPMIK